MENIEMVVKKFVKKLVNWIHDSVKAANSDGVIFGLSGGIDSAVIAGLSKLAFPDNSLGVIMPCHSDKIDEEHGLLVANFLDLETVKVDLSNTFDTFVESTGIEKIHKLALANVKPRLRMTTLYYYGQSNNYLVLGSSNASEYKLAKYLGIPDIIITKAPTAGLWENQTDEDEMGFSYEVLDNYIKTGEGPSEITEKIDKMYGRTAHKRKYPPIFEL